MTQIPESIPAGRERITLGGGCFWCTEAVFREMAGIETVVSGYSGGEKPNPSYEEVCSGNSGHAEVIEMTFDPMAVALKEILQVFFSVHDPTTLNRQGADSGTQYRSVIYYRNDAQKATAVEVMAEIEATGMWPNPIVTELAPFEAFYKAENYHQEYFERNGGQPYCRAVIEPKVVKFRRSFADRLKKQKT